MLFDIDKKNPQTIAAIDDQGFVITYGQLVENCKTISNVIPERELVFCLCENSIGSLSGFISLYENKDVAILLSASIDRELLHELLLVYRPSFLLIPERFLDEFAFNKIYRKYGYILCKTGHEACPLYKDLALLLTTSGSTGSPKLVRHRYGNIEANAKTVAEVFGWTSSERAICELPMQYSMGLNVISSHLYSGGTVLMVSQSLASIEFWEFIKKHKGTSFTGVPFSYEILLKLRFPQMDLPDLTTIAEGGGKLTDSAFIALADYAKRNNKRFFATFGTTETSARMSFLPPDMATIKTGSIGIPVPGSEMYLEDDCGKIIEEANKEGELCYKGPNVTLGYASCHQDLLKGDEFCGVYKTGDIARKDDDGYFYIVGRKKRFLKLYGLRVSLDQCERLIMEKFKVDCGCTGDDSKMEIYILDKRLTEEVQVYISSKTRLPASAFIVNVVESIPRNSAGKINYTDLKL